MSEPVVSMIVAVANNGVIGAKGALPWRIPEDMRWFRQHTLGRPVIMGRKTWESLPKKPLPGRTNIIVTRNKEWEPQFDVEIFQKNFADGHELYVVWDIASAIDHASRLERQAQEVVVIGGAEIYAAAMPFVTKVYLTNVGLSPEGDVFLPPFDRAVWKETFVQAHPALGDTTPGFTFRVLERDKV
jgi:dihydrofolate reductase